MTKRIKRQLNKVNNYRKVYEQHYGPIPIDSDGRTYEIHHIDGDHTNNDPINLKAVTLQEHYDIHYAQGDWGACLAITLRMEISPEEQLKLNQKQAIDRVKNGTHPWIQPEYREHMRQLQLDKIEKGTHIFQGDNHPVYDRIKKGIHHTIGPTMNKLRVDAGTHNFLGGNIQRATQRKRVNDGTHNLLGSKSNMERLLSGTHPSQIKQTCPHCNKTLDIANAKRWHFDKCKQIK
jgi:hypothetical protein